MSDFDPTSKEYDPKPGSGGGDFKYLKKPGTYLLGLRKCLEHDTNVNGKAFSKVAIVVIAGPQKGESFTDRIYREPSSYKRLAMICRAMRITERWDPSKGRELERVMTGRAFKAKVKTQKGNDGNIYAEIKFPELEFTESERAIMEAWEAAFAKRRAEQGVPPPIDEDDPGPTGDDFGDSFGDGDDSGSGDFDDIPF